MPKYECDKCGACCKGTLIVEAEELDVLREPRIVAADQHYAGKSVEQVLVELQSDIGRIVLLACGKPCQFLGPENDCTIYPTRPNCCVGLQAGDEQCQEARREAGLLPLAPVS